MNHTYNRDLIIAIPLFNDWLALGKLLQLIDNSTFSPEIIPRVIVIDDGSTEACPQYLQQEKYRQITSITLLKLRRNMGHQRAIAIGLCYIYQNLNCDLVVVMDGDGEDNPFEINRLIETSNVHNNEKIVFARRSQRSENRAFKMSYFAYKRIYQLLTGKKIEVGNFSLLPREILSSVVVVSEIWNHYSSALHRSKIPYVSVNVPRTKRLDGQPKMNIVSLVTHGLSSIAVHGDIVGTRLLLMIFVLLIFLIFLLVIVVLIRLFTNLAIPGWTTYVVSFLILSGFQVILLGTVFSLLILGTRNIPSIIPIRDYHYFVGRVIELKNIE
jgi:glycosyltransferase involved in cell wall biosynthesis